MYLLQLEAPALLCRGKCGLYLLLLSADSVQRTSPVVSVKGNHGFSMCYMGLHASVVSLSVKTCFCYKENYEFQKKKWFSPINFSHWKSGWMIKFLENSFQIRKPVWQWLDLQVSIFLLSVAKWGMLAHFCSSLFPGLALQKKDMFSPLFSEQIQSFGSAEDNFFPFGTYSQAVTCHCYYERYSTEDGKYLGLGMHWILNQNVSRLLVKHIPGESPLQESNC